MSFCQESFRLFPSFIILLIYRIILVKPLEVKYYTIPIDNEIRETLVSNSKESISHRFEPAAVLILVNIYKEDKGVKSERLDPKPENVRILDDEEIYHLVLRGKQEDACVKVAIRKCYKALMMVKKKLCQYHFRCSRRFKEDFIEYSKSSCIAEFDYSKIPAIKQKQKYGDDFKDYTRQSYIALCIPYMTQQLQSIITNEGRNSSTALTTHIFRSPETDSEKKCRKICRNKCIHACGYVRIKLCSIHECGRRKRWLFKKACKEECQREYRINKYSSESSDYSD